MNEETKKAAEKIIEVLPRLNFSQLHDVSIFMQGLEAAADQLAQGEA